MVFITMSCSWFAWGFVDPFWALFVNQIVGDNYFVAGFFSGIFQFFTVLAVLFWGNLVDIVRPLRLLFWNRWVYLLIGPLYFLAGILQSKIILLVAFLINAFGKGMRDVGEQDFLMQVSDAKTCSRILGVNHAFKSMFWMFGILGGAAVLYFLGAYFSAHTIISYLYLLLTPFVAVGVLILFRHRNEFGKMAEGIGAKIKKVLWREKVVLPLWNDFRGFSLPLKFSLYLFSFLEVLNQVISFFVPLLALELGLSFAEIGVLIAAVYAPFLFLFLFSYLADKYDRLALLQKGFSFTAIPLLFIAFTQDPFLIGMLSASLAFAYAILEPALFGLVASLSPPNKRGEVASLQFFFARIGSIVALLLFGFISEYFGIQTSFLFLSFVTLSIFILTIFLKKYLLSEKMKKRYRLHKKHKLHHHHHIFAHIRSHSARQH